MSPPTILYISLILVIALSPSPASSDDTLTAYEVLQQYDFPVGILPKGVLGYEVDASTGKFKVYLNGTCNFSIQDYDLKYKSTITGVISNDNLRNLKGISVKVLFLWFNIAAVIRDSDELEFSVGIASTNFPMESFVESPQCGCGFDCVSEEGKGVNPNFNFSRLLSAFLKF